LKRIGVTQRVSTQFHGQPHDCLDQAWADLLNELDYDINLLPNLAVDAEEISAYLDRQNFDALILSGGNDIAGLGETTGSQTSLRRDAFERAAVNWARGRRIPLLGVCRGLQFLNLVLGGSLGRIEGHAGTRHVLTRVPGALPTYFDALPTRFDVNSFHNFMIEPHGLAPELLPAATDSAGNVEAYFHPIEPMAAIMWHPEREGRDNQVDRAILRAFLG
jgi:gamma-glutamyl-gamma-aminobutyrate hydrolase PuuD